ncbi:MAG: fuconate dehydratase [Acidimicrobiia bacterium]|nr:fuconate dehydratase [Acidimicrobiia bacterium]
MNGLTIVDVSIHDIRFPTSDYLGGSDAMNTAPDYSASYVQLSTDREGLFGCGFTFTIGRGTEIVTRMVEQLARDLVGRRIDDMVRFMAELLQEVTQDSFLRWLGPEKGVTHLAAAAVLNATWDLWARARGLPLWRLLVELDPEDLVKCLALRYLEDVLTPEEAVAMLQRRRRGHEERIRHLAENGYPGYTTSAGWLGYSDAQVQHLVEKAIDEGWSAFKIKVGRDLDDDLRRARIVRRLIGEERHLMVDANQVWEVPQAIEWVNALSEIGLHWIEEPTCPDDILGHAVIARAVAPVLVATGEHAHNRVMFKQFLSSGAIGVCQIDICRMASVNENISVLLMAEKFDVPVCPHAGGVGLCELVQHLSMFDYIAVSGSLENRWIEYVEHLHEMFVDPVRIKNGSYLLPEAPGFSSEMSPEAIAAYAYPTGTVWRARAAAQARRR